MKYKSITPKTLNQFKKAINTNVIKPSHTDCWIWYGQRDRYGYGVFNTKDSHYFVHRLMYKLHVGSLGASKILRHLCLNTSCCNPGHLLEGIQADNIMDAKLQGRTARGERVKGAKLTADKVRDIRSKYTGKRGEQSALAREYQVNSETIRMIVMRKSWKHI